MIKPTLRITKDQLPQLEAAIRELGDIRVLVGIPKESADNRSDGLSNAELGYIHNFGAPEANIPQREFMAPGVIAALPGITDRLRDGATKAVMMDRKGMEAALAAAGTLAQNGIKKAIQANIPPPLAYSTVLGRIRRRKSIAWKKKRRAAVEANLVAGNAPGEGLFTALIDTGALVNSITWVLRKIKSGIDIAVGSFKKAP